MYKYNGLDWSGVNFLVSSSAGLFPSLWNQTDSEAYPLSHPLIVQACFLWANRPELEAENIYI
jgi:hypothetical protein